MLEDMKSIKQIILIALVIVTSACNDYIDVVPDNVATLDNALHCGMRPKSISLPAIPIYRGMEAQIIILLSLVGMN